jgi:hypothetical protein
MTTFLAPCLHLIQLISPLLLRQEVPSKENAGVVLQPQSGHESSRARNQDGMGRLRKRTLRHPLPTVLAKAITALAGRQTHRKLYGQRHKIFYALVVEKQGRCCSPVLIQQDPSLI